MEGYILIGLLVVGTPIVVALWLVARAVDARTRIEELSRRLGALESEVHRLKTELGRGRPAPVSSETADAPLSAQPHAVERQPEPALAVPPIISATLEPPVMRVADVAPSLLAPPPSQPAPKPAASVPPEPEPAPAPTPGTIPAINWEQFMGVKLFAWIGGLALFLGVAFFVKYSFDNNLVPPELRAALGFLAGVGLLVGGMALGRKQSYALSQTLCGTGVVILYAVTFACRSIYRFDFFGPVPTFLLMVLITAAAFLLAVRLNALVVAVLGMLGGFLTPVLLSTGQDNPLGLFGYIAVLDAGLILVALHRRWSFLTTLAAAGTLLLQIGWAGEFFTAEKYFEGNKILIALAVLLGFNGLFLGAVWQAGRRNQQDRWLAGAMLGLAAAALVFAGWFLSFAPLAQRPWLMFGFVFLVDLAVAALVLFQAQAALSHPLAGLAVFLLLMVWTGDSLSPALLHPALAYCFIFAVLHSVFPLWLQRRRGLKLPLWAGQAFPPLALVLVLIPIFRLTDLSLAVWPFVFLVDLLAIALAVLAASLLSVLVVLLLTLAATGALIFKIPATLTGLPASFFLLGAFAVFFAVAGVWLARKFKPGTSAAGFEPDKQPALPLDLAEQLPVLSGILPFLLLIMATMRLPLTNPSPVFGLALLLVVLLLGVALLLSLEWMPAVALLCVASLETAWHFSRFNPANAVPPLIWYLAFLSVFALFPFLFQRRLQHQVAPWAAAAMAGPPQFFLLHGLIDAAYPNAAMGLLPAAFALPPLLSLAAVLKKTPAASPARLAQMAWFGGVALFFITLIFPIQFDRQWITLGWALEGAALLWLLHRVPHPGLRLAGAGLLLAAFARLALNPAVLDYHPRSSAPIFNWYLYAYGVVTCCLFAGARLLAPPRHRVLGVNAPPLLAGLAIVLAFLLLNIEIADYFSAPGSTLTFQFSGNFARDMTYSIAWALFALGLLVAGISRKTRPLRYAGLGLLSVTLLKLFLHDLALLGQLYRIGAFIGVAVIAMLASFAYQRFFAAGAREGDRP
ncbi:MAG TPA: DUF2339 domain-containing protein [Dongiaceae bacterium]|nr:DUF2339 domain-containing protein [Dongiaceae bacterium]